MLIQDPEVILEGGLRQMAREAAFEDGYGVVMVKRCSLME